MFRNNQLYLTKTHRRLGLIIGVQFLGWTISSIYFSSNKVDDVHGDHRRKAPKAFPKNIESVSPTEAVKETIRPDQWRAFDFLWTFHTMDYDSRDDFNNLLLMVFYIFGLLTVLSGFVLFVVYHQQSRNLFVQP